MLHTYRRMKSKVNHLHLYSNYLVNYSLWKKGEWRQISDKCKLLNFCTCIHSRYIFWILSFYGTCICSHSSDDCLHMRHLSIALMRNWCEYVIKESGQVMDTAKCWLFPRPPSMWNIRTDCDLTELVFTHFYQNTDPRESANELIMLQCISLRFTCKHVY